MSYRIAVIGLGYVGLPVAVAFGEVEPVIGFDVNPRRINALKKHFDYTGELSREDLIKTKITYTDEPQYLSDCNFFIVAVPTPIDGAKKPDLTPLKSASQTVGEYMKKGSIVVFESTVYPGTTEEVCIPILEGVSGLKSGEDFFVGYSPERINPGDQEHTFTQITKVVAGQTKEVTAIIAEVYGKVVKAGVHQASSIKVAEAAKVIENTQRDLNIALMNELAIICDHIGIDTAEVLQAANTKWNFLRFNPGLVGGHCIGVDPYYLTYKAESIGYHPQVILAGRRINDGMGRYITTSLLKQMILKGLQIQGSLVTIVGMTFKENVSDLRNSKVIDIVKELKEFGVDIQLTDSHADPAEASREFGVKVTPFNELKPADAVVLAVPHNNYVERGWGLMDELLKPSGGIVVDIKSVLPKELCPANIVLWRL